MKIKPSLPSRVPFLPEKFISKEFKCTSCGVEFRPDWLAPRPYPLGSEKTAGGYLVRLTVQEKCPACGDIAEIWLPAEELKAIVSLFGDEAVRHLDPNGRILYTYSLVGAAQPLLLEMESEIRKLKRLLRPTFEPDAWKIQMTTIWSGQQRQKQSVFQDWRESDTYQLIAGLEEFFQKAGNKLFKFNIVLVGQPIGKVSKASFERYVQREAYTLLLLHVIDLVSSLGAQPLLHFDAQRPTKADHTIHQWARDTFQGGQANLLTLPPKNVLHG